MERRFAPPAQTAVIHYASPTQWLSDQLTTAVYTLGYAPAQEWMQLPALVLDSTHLGTFATPLPLKLASSLRSQARTVNSAEAIGHALIEQLNELAQPSWMAPRYWMHPQGWLYAEFSPESLAQWLQNLLTLTPYLEVQEYSNAPIAISKGISADPVLFELQYAHARCCSLLNLGHQAQLIQLTNTQSFSLTLPNPVPWLASSGELRLQTESERQLLFALMQFPQVLGIPGAIYGRLHCPELGHELRHKPGHQTLVQWPLNNRTLQTHQRWSQIFQHFYRDCRFLGSVQTKTPELAQTRLASLMVLKNLLEFWLVTLLQVDAPIEL